jgi:transposase
MSKTTNKFAPQVRERAMRMVADHERDYPSRWATVVSIAEKIGCVPQTLHEWVKKAEVDSGQRAGDAAGEQRMRQINTQLMLLRIRATSGADR